MFEKYLPKEAMLKITAKHPPNEEAGFDSMIWKNGKQGRFSVASAYDQITGTNPKEDSRIWKIIWNWKGPERIRIFMWKMQNNGLLTNSERNKRRLGSSRCQICNNQMEDIIHALRDCERIRKTWFLLIQPKHRVDFFSSDVHKWTSDNLSKNWGINLNFRWDLIWGITIWMAWNWRNKTSFDASFNFPNKPVDCIYQHAKEIEQSNRNAYSFMRQKTWEEILVKWEAPSVDWMKVNVDGTVKVQSGLAGSGGLIRNQSGSWLGGFTKFLGVCSPLEAEFWAVLEGLKLAWGMGLRQIILETDSKKIVDLLNSRDNTICSDQNLQNECRKFLDKDWRVQLNHTWREANKCADWLADQSLSINRGLQILRKPPTELESLLLNDAYGVPTPRTVTSV